MKPLSSDQIRQLNAYIGVHDHPAQTAEQWEAVRAERTQDARTIYAPQLCTCEECKRGDALPMRRQGIPGACQMLLPECLDGVTVIPSCRMLPSEPETMPAQRGLSDLPLFGGLQPDMFA